MIFADVIVDISVKSLDRPFQYIVPEEMIDDAVIGAMVIIPFGSGNRELKGYIIGLSGEAKFDVERTKAIKEIVKQGVVAESHLLSLAYWIKENYGSTMNDAIKAVLPVRREIKKKVSKTVYPCQTRSELEQTMQEFAKKHNQARVRVLQALLNQEDFEQGIPYERLKQEAGTTMAVLHGLEEKEIVSVTEERQYRNPVMRAGERDQQLVLNDQQRRIVDTVTGDYRQGIRKTYLIHGVTGSGKTEVYMGIIEKVIAEHKQVIVLIPEIALTFQTVSRFYRRFGERVSVMHSRLSQGEKFDQFERAKAGDIDIMIGPRSALFTPFPHLGLIIIDEEHETSYKSETAPRYHARDVAIERARMNDASVLLGSATPSVDSYYQAMQGKYQLLTLSERVEKKPLPDCEVVDLRSELRAGNRSIFSERLQELMEDRLKKRQQIMLFLNRRGISGFISCRACGYVIQCPHCDVSLSQHAGGRMVCHYCGYEQPLPKICPSCGSKYLGGFKAGTQKIEMLVRQRFPQARVMRMDFDTTRTKDAYEKILHAFANQEADILIGTQMIVKGHDFPNVTLVGVLAADMSLHVPDFHASERTFQLLTQAVGRAGRGKEPGQAVIQTYDPDHFAIQTAKEQDYDAFYKQEIAYRRMLAYPPVWQLLLIHCTGTDPQVTTAAARDLAEFLHRVISQKGKNIMLVGPADASIAKISDVYRKVIYMKAPEYATLVACKDLVERKIKNNSTFSNVSVQFDFNPTSGF